MAEANEPEVSEEGEPTFDAGAVATAAALDEARDDPALRPDLSAFFTAQRELIEAQKHHLHVQLNQLRLKIAGDWMRLALQALTLTAILILVVVIGSIVRDAMTDHGLVIESFSAPPQLVERGLTGEALAEQMLGRIAAIRRIANASSITVSDDVRSGGSDSLKVEVPETGISLDEIERFLHQSLGHARRLDGAVSEDGAGHVVIDVGLTGADPIRVEGDVADVDKLMQQAAEQAFAAFDPVNYVLYLRSESRNDEAFAAAERNFKLAKTPLDIYDGLSLWANTDGDRPRAAQRAALAAQIYPKGWAGWSELAVASLELGHDETALTALRRMVTTKREDQWRNHRQAFPYLMRGGRSQIDRLLGDYEQLESETNQFLSFDRHDVSTRYLGLAQARAGAHDCEAAKTYLADAETTGPLSPSDELDARWRLALCRQDWPEALSAAQDLTAAVTASAASAQATHRGFFDYPLATQYRPQVALALARTGRLADAQALIATSPLDCDFCLRVRGQIAEAAGDHAGADRWFAEAVRQAPSLPFAYLEWGQAKLARGDSAGAIVEFQIGQSKAPRFADIPATWGEALGQRSDYSGALAKFAEANALAPHWRQLHQAWSQVLRKLGRTKEAQAQLAQAGA
jgi:Flp pilus assembly protein TadD